MAGVTEAQTSVMRRRRSCNVGEGVAYTCPFMCRHKKAEEIQAEDCRTDYALAIQEVQKFAENELGDGRHRIKPDTREWQFQRARTIATLRKLKADLDNICVAANYGRGFGIGAEVVGVIFSFIAGVMESRGSSSSQTFMEYGDILTTSGPLVQEASNVIEHTISRGFLLEVAEVLRRDQELSRPLQEWLIFSRNLNANVRAIFGCDINSPNLRTVLNAFSEFTHNYNSRRGIRQSIDLLRRGSSSMDVGGNVPTDRLSRLRSQLERNPEFGDKVQAICSALSTSSTDLAIRDTSEGIRLQRNFFGEGRDDDRVGNSAPENSDAVLAFQAVNAAAKVFQLPTVITNIRERRSRYSEGLQKIIDSLATELRNVEALLDSEI
ncbi:hypothetical protein AVEN_244257-1 [Araneus ventricosus]|uniref:Uncharacterized protein n=1 Tax=Araneus ventricosus TaxID=182803 RepID=A0A4Y2K0Y2_ARAVE|nr:hypothetical protein AVEN_244257-1 [Araneus ventricosus]